MPEISFPAWLEGISPRLYPARVESVMCWPGADEAEHRDRWFRGAIAKEIQARIKVVPGEFERFSTLFRENGEDLTEILESGANINDLSKRAQENFRTGIAIGVLLANCLNPDKGSTRRMKLEANFVWNGLVRLAKNNAGFQAPQLSTFKKKIWPRFRGSSALFAAYAYLKANDRNVSFPFDQTTRAEFVTLAGVMTLEALATTQDNGSPLIPAHEAWTFPPEIAEGDHSIHDPPTISFEIKTVPTTGGKWPVR
jgi:hypothetical protein